MGYEPSSCKARSRQLSHCFTQVDRLILKRIEMVLTKGASAEHQLIAEVHASWITRCLYDHLYPMLVNPASIEALNWNEVSVNNVRMLPSTLLARRNNRRTVILVSRSLRATRQSDFGPSPQNRLKTFHLSALRIWWCSPLEVSQGGFLPLSGMSRQSIEFPPYLVKARNSETKIGDALRALASLSPVPASPSTHLCLEGHSCNHADPKDSPFKQVICLRVESRCQPAMVGFARPLQSGRRKFHFFGPKWRTTLEWQTIVRQMSMGVFASISHCESLVFLLCTHFHLIYCKYMQVWYTISISNNYYYIYHDPGLWFLASPSPACDPSENMRFAAAVVFAGFWPCWLAGTVLNRTWASKPVVRFTPVSICLPLSR